MCFFNLFLITSYILFTYSIHIYYTCNFITNYPDIGQDIFFDMQREFYFDIDKDRKNEFTAKEQFVCVISFLRTHFPEYADQSEKLLYELMNHHPISFLHSVNVAKYAFIFAGLLPASDYNEGIKKQLDFWFWGLHHDIDKTSVDEKILSKKGGLSDDEWKEMRKHADNSAALLKGNGYDDKSVTVAKSHHERWDGKGYPQGLRADEIPFEAQVIAICDGLDAMTTDRTFNNVCSLGQAFDDIKKNSGKRYNPDLVENYADSFHEAIVHSMTSTDEFTPPNIIVF